ncbi:MAG: hypothetical protein C3F11_10525 [Methylocystaceae bacterium]|nr:MAG: hypothetical protein C3F11_10525 [Methylocystaceae bacterium]
MFFNIDADDGNSIRGWLAPDNPSAAPKLIVITPGGGEFEVQAGLPRPDIRDLGIHNTGMVGFDVNATVVPNLGEIDDVEILEAESRLPIYRRFRIDRHVERKLFLFDCSVVPQRRIIAAANKHFTLNYTNSEKYSFETMLVIINNSFNKSIFISGRSNSNRYASYLADAGYVTAAMLRDPFEELAERLLLLRLLSKSDAAYLLPTFITGITPLVDFARDLPFDDQRALIAAFRRATDAQREAMTSPMTRTFGCNVDEFPERRHVSIALENLARMDLVGTRSRFRVFSRLLADLIGADLMGQDEPVTFDTVRTFAATLSRVGPVTDVLEHDLALYSYAEEAMDAALDGVTKDAQAI